LIDVENRSRIFFEKPLDRDKQECLTGIELKCVGRRADKLSLKLISHFALRHVDGLACLAPKTNAAAAGSERKSPTDQATYIERDT
jgi:hypothetical protein